MVVKIYVSGISGNKEVKKRQQRVLMILDSKNIKYELIDITEPGKEDDKEFMQMNSDPKGSKYPLPPQIFNEDEYCGDYDDFDLSNEMDELEDFLQVIPPGSAKAAESKEIQENGNTTSREPSTEKEAAPAQPDSLQERTEATTDVVKEEEESKTEEEEESSKAKEPTPEDVEPTESAEKAEEKSDDQEKEE